MHLNEIKCSGLYKAELLVRNFPEKTERYEYVDVVVQVKEIDHERGEVSIKVPPFNSTFYVPPTSLSPLG